MFRTLFARSFLRHIAFDVAAESNAAERFVVAAERTRVLHVRLDDSFGRLKRRPRTGASLAVELQLRIVGVFSVTLVACLQVRLQRVESSLHYDLLFGTRLCWHCEASSDVQNQRASSLVQLVIILAEHTGPVERVLEIFPLWCLEVFAAVGVCGQRIARSKHVGEMLPQLRRHCAHRSEEQIDNELQELWTQRFAAVLHGDEFPGEVDAQLLHCHVVRQLAQIKQLVGELQCSFVAK